MNYYGHYYFPKFEWIEKTKELLLKIEAKLAETKLTTPSEKELDNKYIKQYLFKQDTK